jgi:hypothetical protein
MPRHPLALTSGRPDSAFVISGGKCSAIATAAITEASAGRVAPGGRADSNDWSALGSMAPVPPLEQSDPGALACPVTPKAVTKLSPLGSLRCSGVVETSPVDQGSFAVSWTVGRSRAPGRSAPLRHGQRRAQRRIRLAARFRVKNRELSSILRPSSCSVPWLQQPNDTPARRTLPLCESGGSTLAEHVDTWIATKSVPGRPHARLRIQPILS